MCLAGKRTVTRAGQTELRLAEEIRVASKLGWPYSFTVAAPTASTRLRPIVPETSTCVRLRRDLPSSDYGMASKTAWQAATFHAS